MSPDSTGIENIRVCGALWGLTRARSSGGRRYRRVHRARRLLEDPGADLFGGHAAAAVICDSTLRQPEILLLDEIIGAGDASFRAKAKAHWSGSSTGPRFWWPRIVSFGHHPPWPL